jgi:hypothetical protein
MKNINQKRCPGGSGGNPLRVKSLQLAYYRQGVLGRKHEVARNQHIDTCLK